MTAPTITPTAIDAFVGIEWIQVVGRHRKELGQLSSLAASINYLGLINPITLTRDGRLVAGQRRLEACRRLGWAEVPVRFIDSLDDAAKLLSAERDENTERKEMLPSEKASLGAALEEIESDRAKERQRDAGREFGRGIASPSQGQSYSGRTSEIVGEALGMGHSTYNELSFAYRVATDPERSDDERSLAKSALDAMDSGQGIQPTVKRLRGALRAKQDAKEAKSAALADPEPQVSVAGDPNWIPTTNDSSARATARRRELIQELADEGQSSYQIADRIGILDSTVRKIARDSGIRLPADEAMGRNTRKKIDSNRIVRETVASFQGLDLSLRLIRYEELDRSEIQDWTVSLADAIRVLNRLKKRLEKEMAQ